MLRKRYITLEIETDEGRPEDWDWNGILFKKYASHKNWVRVVNVEEV